MTVQERRARTWRDRAGWIAIVASAFLLTGASGPMPTDILIGLGGVVGAALAIQRIGDDRWTRREDVVRIDMMLEQLIAKVESLAKRIEHHMEQEDHRDA